MTQTLSLNVTGMKCGGCESSAKTALQKLDGVESVQASFKDKKVEVEFDAAKIGEDAIKQAITEAGFNVEA
ncbi:MAG: heavy-metal-associated domain-containing protein [Gammaproteobacteria bacterium]